MKRNSKSESWHWSGTRGEEKGRQARKKRRKKRKNSSFRRNKKTSHAAMALKGFLVFKAFRENISRILQETQSHIYTLYVDK